MSPSSVSEQALLEALARVIDPHTQKDFVSSKALRDLKIDGTDVSFEVELGYPAKSVIPALQQQLLSAARGVAGVSNVSVKIHSKIVSHAVQRGVKLMAGARNVIAVASGKGGVGKSTTAVNLALALAAEGANVGLLDADIYGPSQPTMTGTSGKPETLDGKLMEPKLKYGLQINSIGFLISDDQAMVWRGPMASQALEQLIMQTRWQDLDYLIVDMPPGTGDIQLTLAQKVPLAGAVIVTTPQDIALIDAKKGIKMFEKVGVPILGLIENMAVHVCSACGHIEHIFGADGGRKMAQEYGLNWLGALPLSMDIRQQADSGRPTVVATPDSPAAQLYRDIAIKLAAQVALRAKDFSAKFPTITISKDT
jgi:ATP-binding protein involved in chromosome partitioning